MVCKDDVLVRRAKGWTYREIADDLGCSRNAVAGIVYRATNLIGYSAFVSEKRARYATDDAYRTAMRAESRFYRERAKN